MIDKNKGFTINADAKTGDVYITTKKGTFKIDCPSDQQFPLNTSNVNEIFLDILNRSPREIKLTPF